MNNNSFVVFESNFHGKHPSRHDVKIMSDRVYEYRPMLYGGRVWKYHLVFVSKHWNLVEKFIEDHKLLG